ncbi:flagellar protein export ATPase FliI [Proteinivorax hydrogeniformans]|uniref:Flagellar protein export ATPase FliI n=1 Tax=Proteinivorax hydrogeniformans TaxID=1826727 RepID=A0AAU8HQR0_9FIRM
MTDSALNIDYFQKKAEQILSPKAHGTLQEVTGLTLKCKGPWGNIGDICTIRTSAGDEVFAEIVGFKADCSLLMPLGDIKNIGPGCEVKNFGHPLTVKVSDKLLGRVLDGLGNPLDGKGPIYTDSEYPTVNEPPSPLKRPRIKQPLSVGVKPIDGLLTMGKGQRMGIFAGSGVGKSTLLGMVSRNTKADINVIALIGERGREVMDFIERDLGEEGLKRSVVIVATSDQPPLVRLKGAFVATSIAEYFRDQKKDVMLLMDSVTRFAMAQREIGLSLGEPPTTRGYTPSVFTLLPKLFERSGTSELGSITGIYTVLVDGDDFNEPVTDAVRGILDGHIILSRDIASQNHYPAIDILNSVSRVMGEVVDDEHKELAANLRKVLGNYKKAEDLINIGAYKKGSNNDIDEAIEKNGRIMNFLKQSVDSKYSLSDSVELLKEI